MQVLKILLLSLHTGERGSSISLVTPAAKIFLHRVGQVITRETHEMARDGPFFTSQLKYHYYAPILRGGCVFPWRQPHNGVVKTTFKKIRHERALIQFPLKKLWCLNTSLSLPLYFACTQLRDNLAIYHVVLGLGIFTGI